MSMTFVISILGGAALVLGMLMWAAAGTVLRMSRDDSSATPLDESSCQDERDDALSHDALARGWGLEWLGMFACSAVPQATIAVWRDPTEATFLCLYFVGGRQAFDFVTLYENQRSLTTASTADAHTLPVPPGSFVQSVPGASLEEQHQRHEEAQRVLGAKGFIPRGNHQPFEDLFVEALRTQAQFVRSQPLWPCVILWRYFFTRSKLAGVTISDGHVEQEQLRRAA